MALPFPDIDPVALAVGPLVIRWYALAYLAGFLLGWGYALYLARLYMTPHPNREDVDDFLTWAILGVLLGGRLGYVLFYQFPFYLQNPEQVLQIWHGGMAFHGGVVGVILALIFFSLYKKVPLLKMCDLASAAAPIGVFFGRITNFINGELFGRASDVPWAVTFPRGGELPRHPSQIYESLTEGLLLFLILCVAMHNKKIREYPGIVSGIFLICYAGFRSFVELFREPDAQLGFIIGHISMGQLLSLPMALFGLCVIIYALKKGPKVHAEPA
ncbi:MAG: prolipoprotein diacylglyceryl transferase [Alphaproteobacteria bacterium]